MTANPAGPASAPPMADERWLSAAERELVDATAPGALAGQSRGDLQALGKRLREARDRARTIARRQHREMRGKAEPRGAALAQDNTGSAGKTEMLVAALKQVTLALRRLQAPTQTELAQKALAAKRASQAAAHPAAPRTAASGAQPKPSKARTVRMDPREVGRVSQAGKRTQARRDGGNR